MPTPTYQAVHLVAPGIDLIRKCDDQNLGKPYKAEVQYDGNIFYRMARGELVVKSTDVYPDTPQGRAEFARELDEKSKSILASLPEEYRAEGKEQKERKGRKSK